MAKTDTADCTSERNAPSVGKQYEQHICIQQQQRMTFGGLVPMWVREAVLTGKQHLRIFLKRMGDAPLKMTITPAAKLLSEQSKLTVGTCKNLLRNTGIWKKKPRGRPNPPRPRSK